MDFNLQNTNFQFKAQSLSWLVIDPGKTTAQFRSQGTVNGSLAPSGDPYELMVWATDGNPDTIRIRIWWVEAGVEHVVYDTMSLVPTGGGNIQIH